MLPVAFSMFSGYILLVSVLEPLSIGSHAAIYTAASDEWLRGGDPWSVGPPAAVFAGPPPMLALFAPFTVLPELANRVIWVGLAATAAVLVVRRLRLPAYWIGFPPIFQSIMLGHPEVIVLLLVVSGGALAGLGASIKPYAVAPLIAERRWRAIALAAAFLVITAPLLPWGLFLERLPAIASTLERQSNGDSTFGNPLLMIVAVLLLSRLGGRRALWLATPLLWPSAQFLYRTLSVPYLSPLIAIAWAFPVPGATLAGLAVDAVVRTLRGRIAMPDWIAAGADVVVPSGDENHHPESTTAGAQKP
ncbi:MAG: glycosyltransferase family 87 protein [Candidatus Limnocylindria bacterium]